MHDNSFVGKRLVEHTVCAHGSLTFRNQDLQHFVPVQPPILSLTASQKALWIKVVVVRQVYVMVKHAASQAASRVGITRSKIGRAEIVAMWSEHSQSVRSFDDKARLNGK